MVVQFQIRRGTAEDWAFKNPILAEGEMGLETDTEKCKVGDGITPWNDKKYWLPVDIIDGGSSIV